MKRRDFIKGTSAAVAGTVITVNSFAYIKNPSRISAVKIGVIGCNGMGWANVNSLLKISDVELVAICDVDQNVVTKRLNDYSALRKNKPTVYKDYRELLNDKSVDAVVIGTPDHWHCMIMVDAVKAGKHVYVEKPIANTIEECNLMVAAQEKTGRIVQVGQWQRSGPHYRKAYDIVRSGILGKIRLVKTWAYQGWMKPVPILPNSTPPEGVDYKFWLGPAPERPFNPNRFHFNFRWFWDYAGGLMTDWGVHEIDIALWIMGATAPLSVTALGGKIAYPDDASETPDTLQAMFQYPDFNMLWEHATGIDGGNYGRTEGIAFIGNNGTLVVNRGGYEVIVEKERKGQEMVGKMELVEAFEKPRELNYLDLHTQNFINAISEDKYEKLHTPIQSGSLAAINAQMGNISYKLGEKVSWDDQKKMFIGNDKANRLMKAAYYNDWRLPTL